MEETNLAPYSIYAESTPNPATMKFVANRYLITSGASYEYTAKEDRTPSPLAAQLFSFPFVTSVFMASNFVTVTKADSVDWVDIHLELREFIRDFFQKGGIAVDESKVKPKEGKNESQASSQKVSYTDFEQKIIDTLDEYIRPAVESDGGAIAFKSYEDGVVSVILQGSCSGCPSATVTLKHGIEQLLKNMYPEITQVIAYQE